MLKTWIQPEIEILDLSQTYNNLQGTGEPDGPMTSWGQGYTGFDYDCCS